MNIDWMLLTYLIVGFTAVIGFFRGWWKEAITLSVLAVLMILLQRPDWAEALVSFLNGVIATILQLFTRVFGFTLVGESFQFDATSSGSWVLILILLLGLSSLATSLILPGYTNRKKGSFYPVELTGRAMGLLLGAANGFLIINLIREYLDGRALPGSTPPETTITLVGASSFGPASTALSFQAVNLPSFTILDSYVPWVVIGAGLFVAVAALHNRVRIRSEKGIGSKIEVVAPYGYTVFGKRPPPQPDKQAPVKVEVMNLR